MLLILNWKYLTIRVIFPILGSGIGTDMSVTAFHLTVLFRTFLERLGFDDNSNSFYSLEMRRVRVGPNPGLLPWLREISPS
jgi:hypothetical protein